LARFGQRLDFAGFTIAVLDKIDLLLVGDDRHLSFLQALLHIAAVNAL
jgi:hypothetical protein